MTGRGRRISDWKGIAAYFDRDERTARRWERQRRLPVHRIAGGARSLVYAYEDELEAWLHAAGTTTPGNGAEDQRAADAGDRAITAGDEAATRRATAHSAGQRLRRAWWALAGAAAVVLVGAIAVAVRYDGLIAPDAEAHAPHVPAADVHELYLDATYHLATRQEAGFRRAISGLTEATRRDPEYAAAFAGLAEAYNTISQFTLMPAEEAYPLAREAALRAIALDSRLAHGYATLAFTEFYWERDFDASKALFEQAVALDPDVAQVRHWYALTRMVTGDFEVALREIAAARALNPESRVIAANAALIQFHAGMVADALAALRALAEAEPKLRSPPEYLATIYLDQRNHPQFLQEYRRAATISGNPARLAIADAAEAGFAEGGGLGLLSAMLDAQIAEHNAGREPAYKLAATASMLGDLDAAIGYLEVSLAAGEQDMLGVRIDPAFRALRDDERYQQILESVGFAS